MKHGAAGIGFLIGDKRYAWAFHVKHSHNVSRETLRRARLLDGKPELYLGSY
jgi:hypothetical protein